MKKLLFCLLGLTGQQLHAQIDVQHYQYEIELNDKSDGITGKAWITVKFTEEAARVEFDLASIEGEKGMMAFQAKEGGQLLTLTHRNDVVSIQLTKPAQAGEIRTFEIQYMGIPRDGLIISKNKFGERTFFADNWPNQARHWIPANDHPSDKATVSFLVKAPAHYKVISNGLLQEEKRLNDDMRLTHWKEDIPIPTKVMVIGAANFAVARVDSQYRFPVTAWVYAQDSAKGVYDYALADDVLTYFEGYVGPYPFKKLANVQSTTMFGGMENANAIFYAENSVTGDRKSEALIAHEIAHQWFGNTATEKDFAHLWLSEGFATYLTHMYLEKKYGKDTLLKRLEEDRGAIIKFAKANTVPIVDSSSDLMDLLNANSYQKGSWVLHMLRQEVGDALFQQIIQEYYKQFKGGNADSRDFQLVAERVTGRSMAPFFRQWLYGSGIPELNARWVAKTDKQIEVNVQQQGKVVYDTPLEIEIKYKNGTTEVQKITLSKAAESFLIPVKEKPVSLALDPNKRLLHEGKISPQ